MVNIKESVLFKTFMLIICLGLTFGIFSLIKDLFCKHCNKRKPTLMLEGFATTTPPPKVSPSKVDSKEAPKVISTESSEKTPEDSPGFTKIMQKYASLNDRLDVLDKNIQNAINSIDNIEYKYSNIQQDICENLNRVDDGIRGIHCSKVPKDEFTLPLSEQDKRNRERRSRSNVYLKLLKSSFRSSTNKNILECFYAPDAKTDPSTSENTITMDEYNTLENVKKSLNKKVFEIKSSLEILKISFNKLKNSVTDRKIATYYATLEYNDVNFKNILDSIKPTTEGFAGSVTNTPTKASPQAAKASPQAAKASPQAAKAPDAAKASTPVKATPNTSKMSVSNEDAALNEEAIVSSMEDEFITVNKNITNMNKDIEKFVKLIDEQKPKIQSLENAIPKPATNLTAAAASPMPNKPTNNSSEKNKDAVKPTKTEVKPPAKTDTKQTKK